MFGEWTTTKFPKSLGESNTSHAKCMVLHFCRFLKGKKGNDDQDSQGGGEHNNVEENGDGSFVVKRAPMMQLLPGTTPLPNSSLPKSIPNGKLPAPPPPDDDEDSSEYEYETEEEEDEEEEEEEEEEATVDEDSTRKEESYETKAENVLENR